MSPSWGIERSGDDLLLRYTGGTTGLPKEALWRQGTLLDYGLATTAVLQGETAPETLDDLAAAGPTVAPRRTSVGVLLDDSADQRHRGASAATARRPAAPPSRSSSAGRSRVTRSAERSPNTDPASWKSSATPLCGASSVRWMRPRPATIRTTSRRCSASTIPVPWSARQLKDALLTVAPCTSTTRSGSTEAVGFGFARTNHPGESATARIHVGSERVAVNAELRDIAPGSSESGVLAVRRSCGLGYYKDPDLTARAFPEIDGERHAMPGDWATLGADRTLTLLGRGSRLHQLRRREGVAGPVEGFGGARGP